MQVSQWLYNLCIVAAFLIICGMLLVCMDFFRFSHIWTGGNTPALNISEWVYLWDLYCSPKTYLIR